MLRVLFLLLLSVVLVLFHPMLRVLFLLLLSVVLVLLLLACAVHTHIWHVLITSGLPVMLLLHHTVFMFRLLLGLSLLLPLLVPMRFVLVIFLSWRILPFC